MAIEPLAGFTSLRLHESSFLIAMPENHSLAALNAVPLDALRNEYFVTLPSVHSIGLYNASARKQALRPLLFVKPWNPKPFWP
jgi:DNA-binding transcriptional LysR family regulator